MNNVPEPYIGLTGLTKRHQAITLLNHVKPQHLVMIGVLASYKTLSGRLAGQPARYPVREDISGIFPEKSSRTLNLVHLNSREDPEQLRFTIDAACNYGGPNMQGLQLNMAWPSPDTLGDWKSSLIGRDMRLVLQIGSAAMEACENDPFKMARRIALVYAGIVDYVLLDGSMGTGKPMDPASVRTFFYEMLARDVPIGLGAAGGLDAANAFEVLPPLFAEFGRFSVDAEGRLRTSDDQFSLVRGIEYLRAVDRL